MALKFRFAFFSAMASSLYFIGVFLPACTAAQAVDASPVAGSWTGQFGRGQWTFEFSNEGGEWTGRYMDTRHQRWHPLHNIRVSGRSVSFNIESTPQLSFSLSVDEANMVLSGLATVPDIPAGAGIPYSGTRNP